MILNVWVKDKYSGKVHQVGTDVHDSLQGIGNSVEYYNLQSGDGTPYGYEFIEPPNMDDYVCVTPEEFFLNKELVHKDLMEKLRLRAKEIEE